MDLVALTQAGSPTIFSHIVLMWGLIADIDIESEKYYLLTIIILSFNIIQHHCFMMHVLEVPLVYSDRMHRN